MRRRAADTSVPHPQHTPGPTGTVPRRRIRSELIIGAVASVLLLTFGSLAISYTKAQQTRWDKARSGIAAQGFVVDVDHTYNSRGNPFTDSRITRTDTTVEFRLDGMTRTASLEVRGALYVTPEPVTVYVDPSDPGNVALGGFKHPYGDSSGTMVVLWLVMLGAVLGPTVVSAARRGVTTTTSRTPARQRVHQRDGTAEGRRRDVLGRRPFDTPIWVPLWVPSELTVLWALWVCFLGFVVVVADAHDRRIAALLFAASTSVYAFVFAFLARKKVTWDGVAITAGRRSFEPLHVEEVIVSPLNTVAPAGTRNGGIVHLAHLGGHLLRLVFSLGRRSKARRRSTVPPPQLERVVFRFAQHGRRGVGLWASLYDLRRIPDALTAVADDAWDEQGRRWRDSILSRDPLPEQRLAQFMARFGYTVAVVSVALAVVVDASFADSPDGPWGRPLSRTSVAINVLVETLDPLLAPYDAWIHTGGGACSNAQEDKQLRALINGDDKGPRTCSTYVMFDDNRNAVWALDVQLVVDPGSNEVRVAGIGSRLDALDVGMPDNGVLWFASGAGKRLSVDGQPVECFNSSESTRIVVPPTTLHDACRVGSALVSVSIDESGDMRLVE
jgi:hypothetical protein